MRVALVVALLLAAAAGRAAGDVVTLKSGEKVRGKIVSREGGTIVVESPERTWEIAEDKVASVEERGPLMAEFHAQTGGVADTDTEGFYRVARWCEDKGLYDVREDVLNWVIGLDPDHEGARAALGYYRARNGQWVKGQPADANKEVANLFRKAVDHYRKGEDEPAEALLKKLLEQSPGHVDGQYLLGDIYYAQGKFGQARREFELLQKAASDYSWGAYGLAAVSLAEKKYADAKTFAQKALATAKELEPATHRKLAEAEFHYVLGLSYRFRGPTSRNEAEKAFKECVNRDRRHFRAWTELGIIDGAKGKFREAFNAFGKALAAENTYVPARYNWGVALYRSGNQKEALIKLLPLTRPPLVHVEALRVVGRCYHRFNDLVRARQYYTEYLDKGGKDARVAQWLREVQ